MTERQRTANKVALATIHLLNLIELKDPDAESIEAATAIAVQWHNENLLPDPDQVNRTTSVYEVVAIVGKFFGKNYWDANYSDSNYWNV